MKYCQIIILILLAIGFISSLRVSRNGRPAKEPDGFVGVLLTIIVAAVFFTIYWKAGAFSLLF